MSDLYQQLDNNRKVNPRTQDGFRSATFNNERSPQNEEQASNSFNSSVSDDKVNDINATSSLNASMTVDSVRSSPVPQDTQGIDPSTTPDYLVETSKSKLVTLEVSLR